MSEKMTVYHGTGRLGKCDFDEFKPDYRGAIWTVTNKERAERYAPQNENGVVLTCEAELKNPAHFAYGSGENWDIDDTVRKAREAGCDSAIIDFEFRSREHDYFKFVLENFPNEPAKKIVNCIAGEASSICRDDETISQFAERMARQNNIDHSYVAVFSPEQVKIISREPVMKEQVNENAERLKQISEHDELGIYIQKDDPDFVTLQKSGITVAIDDISREVSNIVMCENGSSQELIDRFNDEDYPSFVLAYVDFDFNGSIERMVLDITIENDQFESEIPSELMSEEFQYAVTAEIEKETGKSITELIAEVQNDRSNIAVER